MPVTAAPLWERHAALVTGVLGRVGVDWIGTKCQWVPPRGASPGTAPPCGGTHGTGEQEPVRATSSQSPGGIETAHNAGHARCALDINARTS